MGTQGPALPSIHHFAFVSTSPPHPMGLGCRPRILARRDPGLNIGRYPKDPSSHLQINSPLETVNLEQSCDCCYVLEEAFACFCLLPVECHPRCRSRGPILKSEASVSATEAKLQLHFLERPFHTNALCLLRCPTQACLSHDSQANAGKLNGIILLHCHISAVQKQ